MSSEKYTRNSILKRTNELEEESKEMLKRLYTLQTWASHTEVRLQIIMDLLHTYNIILSLLAFLLFLGLAVYLGFQFADKIPIECFMMLNWVQIQVYSFTYNIYQFLKRELLALLS
jgi:hypothetical protein